jgi:hypothetical protein
MRLLTRLTKSVRGHRTNVGARFETLLALAEQSREPADRCEEVVHMLSCDSPTRMAPGAPPRGSAQGEWSRCWRTLACIRAMTLDHVPREIFPKSGLSRPVTCWRQADTIERAFRRPRARSKTFIPARSSPFKDWSRTSRSLQLQSAGAQHTAYRRGPCGDATGVPGGVTVPQKVGDQKER